MEYKTVLALITVFEDLWSQTFSVLEYRRRPLKLGIDKDILATGIATPAEVSAALRFYTGNFGYLRACREGEARVGLDGAPTGVVTAAEAANCAQRLQAYRAAKANGKTPPIPNRAAPAPAQPKRLGLSDLREAYQARQREQGVRP